MSTLGLRFRLEIRRNCLLGSPKLIRKSNGSIGLKSKQRLEKIKNRINILESRRI